MDLCPLRRQEKRLCNRPRVGLVSKAACRCARPIRKKGLGRLVEGSCKGRLHRLVCSFVVQKQSTFRPCNIPRKLGCCNHSGIDKAALRYWWWCCWCRFGRAYCLYKTTRSTTPQPSAQPATAPNAEIPVRSASTHLLDVVCCASCSLFFSAAVPFLLNATPLFLFCGVGTPRPQENCVPLTPCWRTDHCFSHPRRSRLDGCEHGFFWPTAGAPVLLRSRVLGLLISAHLWGGGDPESIECKCF